MVIGSGALGASVAFHLAALGRRVALLDRFDDRLADVAARGRLDAADPARSGDDAAGHARGAEDHDVHRGDRRAPDLPPGWQRQNCPDGVRRRPNPRGDLCGPAGSSGSTSHEIGPSDLTRLAPWARPSGALAMWYTPSDLYLEPGQIPLGYAQGRGARLARRCCRRTEVTQE
ncbi:MAG: hypothetical protein KatS3mg059_0506 [Thermomicrobiales bacterium]|nr:MAG: hypothetical protein KatS3mg059_0506 [Thermomicrobiales bacterium]